MRSGASPPWGVVVSPLVPFPPQSGGQKRTLRLLGAMERSGIRPHLLSPDVGAEEAASELRRRGWEVELVGEPAPSLRSRLGQHARRLPSPYLSRLASRLGDLTRLGPALVQLEHTQSAYYLELAGSVPSVLSLHNVDSELLRRMSSVHPRPTIARLRTWNRFRATRAVERRALPRATHTLCVSAGDAQAVTAAGGNALLAPNGVDDDLFDVPHLAGHEGAEVLFFGRLDYEPNHRGLLRFLHDGWPSVAAARPDARLRVVGAGADSSLLREAAAAERVQVAGVAADIAHELARATCVVVPLWQGGGTRLKVIESLAAGRPVVATPVGVEELGFEDGRHGLIGATPKELAAGVTALLRDPVRAAALGRQARAHADRFRWSTTLAPVEALYRSL